MIDVLRFFRAFRGAPVHTAAAIGTLSLGIGATTLAFSLVWGSLLRPLPFDQPDELYVLHILRSTDGRPPALLRWNWPKFDWLSRQALPFESIAAFNGADVNLSAGSALPERVAVEFVSGAYFEVLRARPAVGRTFAPEETSVPQTYAVTVLSHELWTRRFGADPAALGGSIMANGIALTVIGVMPSGFAGLSGHAGLWIPQMMAPAVSFAEQLTSTEHFLSVVGRVATDISRDRFAADVERLGARVAEAVPSADLPATAVERAVATPLSAGRADAPRRRATVLLFGAVWLVLGIACVNLAALLLARGKARAHEFAVRLALGCNRRRLIRQLLGEAVLLALAGAAGGVLLAVAGNGLVTRFGPQRVRAPANDYGAIGEFVRFEVNGTVLGFAIVTGVIAALGAAIVPALRAARTDVARDLVERSRAGSGSRSRRPATLGVLTTAQIALALTLVTGAGVLLRGLSRSLTREVGIETDRILTFRVDPADASFSTTAGAPRIERILERIAQVPGVESATVSLCTPWMICSSTLLFFEGAGVRLEDAPVVGRHYVGPDHFQTLGIPLVRGRAFDAQDRAGRPRVTVVSETAARRFWPGEDPIGRRVWLGGPPGSDDGLEWEVVGVAGDVVYWPPDGDPGADFYTPHAQYGYAFSMFMVKTRVPPLTLLPALAEAVDAIEPGLPVHDVRTMQQRARTALSSKVFEAGVLSAFALLALLLAAVGTYGLAAYAVGQRTRELGIRLALGASPRRILRTILADAGRVAAAGIAAGFVLSVVLLRVLRSLTAEVAAADPLTFAGAAGLLAASTLLAALGPAARAARVDPAQSLVAE